MKRGFGAIQPKTRWGANQLTRLTFRTPAASVPLFFD